MKPKMFSGYLSSAFYAALLSVALPALAQEAKGVEIRLSEVELQEIFNNPRRSYVYVGEVSGIADVMAELSKLDDNPTSLIHGLVAHIEKGFNIGNYDAVAQALEEAEQLLIKHADALGEEKAAHLTRTLDAIIEQVIDEKLNLDAELLSFLKDSVVQEDATKGGCCKPKPHCHGLRLLVVKEKVDFQGKVKFREDVRFKDDVVFEDDVTFEDPVLFEDNVTIEGALSVTDLVVLSCVDNLCVTNLSVTDLAVASCIDNLCVNTLSVTDLIIGGGSGTLSVNDLVASTIDSLCDLTVGCNINMVNSTDAAHGNVIKAGSPFIHNFGTNNTFVGINAGNFTTTGVGGNTALGVNALSANTTGETCTAVGSNALAAHTTGTSNVAVGANALNATTTSDFNIGLGSNALLLNITGTRNVALGDSALRDNVTGSNNIAVGKDSLFFNTIGNNNTAIGDMAANILTTGSNNISIGAGSGGTLTTGSGNIYIDASAALAAEATTTRIGTSQNRCFIAGIRGITTGVANAIAVLIDGNGQLGTVSSSAQYKHDIEDMGSSSDAVMQLRPVTFVYNADESGTTQYGLIAEEVDQVFPAIVAHDANGQPETVQYHVLPVLVLNELQKLAARVAALEALQN